MTGREAREIYVKACGEAIARGVDDAEAVLQAWDIVADAINAEVDRDWALRYLALTDFSGAAEN